MAGFDEIIRGAMAKASGAPGVRNKFPRKNPEEQDMTQPGQPNPLAAAMGQKRPFPPRKKFPLKKKKRINTGNDGE